MEWIITVLVVGFISTVVWMGSHHWKQRTVARLNAGSQLLATARGVLEYGDHTKTGAYTLSRIITQP